MEYAVELTERGLSAEEIVLKLLQKRDKVRVLALVDTLEYLKKGGRISSAVALAGGLLNIKPVISVNDGEIKVQHRRLFLFQCRTCRSVQHR